MFLNYETHYTFLQRITTAEQVARIARLTDHFLTRLVELGPQNDKDNLYMYRYNSTLELYTKARAKVGEKAMNEWLDQNASNNAFETYMRNIEPQYKYFDRQPKFLRK